MAPVSPLSQALPCSGCVPSGGGRSQSDDGRRAAGDWDNDRDGHRVAGCRVHDAGGDREVGMLCFVGGIVGSRSLFMMHVSATGT